MKIVMLAARNSTHTARWANAFVERGHDVHVVSIQMGGPALDERVVLHVLPWSAPFGYIANVWKLKRLLRQLRPDVMNVHYASGYGALGALSGFHPVCLNVWGSDVYEFPYRNAFTRWLIGRVLKSADQVASTSIAMAQQTATLAKLKRPIEVTPFGVDTALFAPAAKDERQIIIGTIKLLSAIYGQDVLIDAFAQTLSAIQRARPEVAAKLRLMIVGDGPARKSLEDRCRSLGIMERVVFAGSVDHLDVPKYLSKIDIFAALTRVNESFGVAVIEASAAGLPVVVTDVPGFREVVEDQSTGLIIPREDVSAAKEAFEALVLNSDERRRMGLAGRDRVRKLYEWSGCVDRLEAILRRL